MKASGSFRPGQPVQITVNARGLLRTSNAEVRLVLPEVAALRAGGGQRIANVLRTCEVLVGST